MINKKIVGEQETGKTTYLYNTFLEMLNNNEQIIIMDSATDHQEKSLLKKVENNFDNAVVIGCKDENGVILNKIGFNNYINKFYYYFPFNDVYNNSGKIICFDLSFFLEKGYEVFEKTNDKEDFYYYRSLYNNLSNQIALSLILMNGFKILNETNVIMDEIEFPIVNYDISKLQKNIRFIASVHPENAFGTFYDSFELVKYKKYIKGDKQ